MKRNYILKVTLILTTVVLIVGIGGSFIGKSNTCSKENQVVKATIVDEKQNADKNNNVDEKQNTDENNNVDEKQNVDENKNIDEKQDTDESAKNQIKNLDKKDIKEEKNIDILKVENITKEESNKQINNKIKEENPEKKIENTKQEQKDEKKKENLKVEDRSQELVNKSGYARDYYEKDGELFIIFDEAEFFRNEEARKAYFKDGNTEEPMEEWGNDYYIRNNDNSTKVYKVNKDAKLELLAFEVGANNSIDLVSVTPDKVKEKIDKYKNNKSLERGLLFNIDESNDVVYGMRAIYTP